MAAGDGADCLLMPPYLRRMLAVPGLGNAAPLPLSLESETTQTNKEHPWLSLPSQTFSYWT